MVDWFIAFFAGLLAAFAVFALIWWAHGYLDFRSWAACASLASSMEQAECVCGPMPQ